MKRTMSFLKHGCFLIICVFASVANVYAAPAQNLPPALAKLAAELAKQREQYRTQDAEAKPAAIEPTASQYGSKPTSPALIGAVDNPNITREFDEASAHGTTYIPSNNPSWYVDFTIASTHSSKADLTGSTLSNRIETDDSFAFSGALGYRPQGTRGILKDTRYEIEGAYRSSDISNDGVSPTAGSQGNLEVMTLMANMFWDLRNATRFTPYAGGGLGLAQVKLAEAERLNLTDDKDFSAAYQLMTGIIYNPSQESLTEIHLGYRYFNLLNDLTFLQNAATGDVQVQMDQESHNVEAGVRLYF